MLCPTCATSLGTGRHEGVEVHYCSTCSGRFVGLAQLREIVSTERSTRSDAERAAALAAAGTAVTRPDDRTPARSCPVCQVHMRRFVYQYDSGVWIDACDAHGAWLDAGELERLEALVEGIARGGVVTSHPPSDIGVERPEIAKFDVHDPYGSPLSRAMSSHRENVWHDFVVNRSRHEERQRALDDAAAIEHCRSLAEAIVASERQDDASA